MIRRLRARRGVNAEAGMTLVEILVALTILGLAIAGITSGLGTASLASATHRRTVNADTILRDYAEAIKQSVRAGNYKECAVSGDYNADKLVPAFNEPAGYRVSQTQSTYQQLGGALNVVLVLDTSYSITQAGAVSTVRNAASAFVNGLQGTGARAALVSFGTTATVWSGATTDLASLDAKIKNNVNFGGVQWTNWEDGLLKARNQFSTFPAGSRPVVVMVTDGDPNVEDQSDSTSLTRAVSQANEIKSAGSKIFGVGVGSLQETNLQKISGKTSGVAGTKVFNPPTVPFNEADYTKTGSFSSLQSELTKVAAALAVDTFVTGTCPSPDQGAQALTLTAASVDGRQTETVEIVVRQP
jgi:prepilin-type N-terminal cleavage/methylation domain-containing protein